MKNFIEYISSQFKNPQGLGGTIVGIIQNTVNQAMYSAAVHMTEFQSDGKILDIGYGNGYLLKKLYRKQPVDMYGIDISCDAEEMARRKNAKAANANHLHLSVGDCCDLPYEDNMFEAIISINTVYFWSDTLKGLSEVHRTLKTGKSFYNFVFTKEYLNTIKFTQTGYKKFTRDELIQYGRQAGFENIVVKEVVEGKSFAVIYTK